MLENHPFIQSREEIEDSVFFPFDLCQKYHTKYFLELWRYLLGKANLSKEQLRRFHSKGLLNRKKLTENEIVNVLKNKSPQLIKERKYFIFDVCDWCKCETYVLHEHHYPIQKKDGGKETVDICANCHCEFHILKNTWIYEPVEEIKIIFEQSLIYKENLLKEFDEKEQING